MTRTITKILVANRGEIARRIFRTCRAMGIGTVAVYSDADAAMPFVREADEAVCIGPAPSRESYLVVEKIIEAAQRTGADAIHPGYGFLSENAAFAEACAAAGITFLGPKAAAIRAMGLKREAKLAAVAANVPVVPGYAGAAQDDKTLMAEAAKVGFPLLIKASAGGGGKGMRIVRGAGDVVEALGGARREAKAAFGDDTLLLEKYIEAPRHVEIQILGDAHGHVVHLFERECSIQRRYQKIVEESPSPVITPARREEMGAAAVRLAQAIGYENAGTVEFIVAPGGEFYFLEVNTRLQVEHPVTECVTGVDLVREQIRVAEGHPLPFGQQDLALKGAAIEVRLYAEDPAAGFLPQSGTVLDWHLPELPGLRVDGGVVSGTAVGIHYDPMLAKIIGFGETREEARRCLIAGLANLSVSGIRHNRDLLLSVLRHPDFVAGQTDTHFLDRCYRGDFAFPVSADALRACATAAAMASFDGRCRASAMPEIAGYRNNRFAPETITYAAGDTTVTVAYVHKGHGRFDLTTTVGSETVTHDVQIARAAAPEYALVVDGYRRPARVIAQDLTHHVGVGDARVTLVEAPRFPERIPEVIPGAYTAPMPGKVAKLPVKVGDAVRAGDVLLVLEAMKMEHTLRVTDDGTVSALHVTEGAQVDGGALLAVVTAK